MTDSCLFCKIVRSEAKANIVYDDEQVIAFRDIHPVAPTHILIVPRRHIESINDIHADDAPLIGHMFIIARQIARQENIHEGGYRIIVNTGPDGGQTVFHMHLHLIGGQPMKQPMG
jgi:histidine triad (HIT) family protein